MLLAQAWDRFARRWLALMAAQLASLAMVAVGVLAALLIALMAGISEAMTAAAAGTTPVADLGAAAAVVALVAAAALLAAMAWSQGAVFTVVLQVARGEQPSAAAFFAGGNRLWLHMFGFFAVVMAAAAVAMVPVVLVWAATPVAGAAAAGALLLPLVLAAYYGNWIIAAEGVGPLQALALGLALLRERWTEPASALMMCALIGAATLGPLSAVRELPGGGLVYQVGEMVVAGLIWVYMATRYQVNVQPLVREFLPAR